MSISRDLYTRKRRLEKQSNLAELFESHDIPNDMEHNDKIWLLLLTKSANMPGSPIGKAVSQTHSYDVGAPRVSRFRTLIQELGTLENVVDYCKQNPDTLELCKTKKDVIRSTFSVKQFRDYYTSILKAYLGLNFSKSMSIENIQMFFDIGGRADDIDTIIHYPIAILNRVPKNRIPDMIELVKLLVKNGADVNRVNHTETPLDILISVHDSLIDRLDSPGHKDLRDEITGYYKQLAVVLVDAGAKTNNISDNSVEFYRTIFCN